MKIFIYLLFIINLIYRVKCGHLLVIHCVPTGSYANIMEEIVNTLASEHQITFLSMSHKNYAHPNVTLSEIKLPNFFYMKAFENIFEKMMKQDSTSDDAETVLFRITPEYVKGVLADESFQNLLKTKTKFDMLITFTSISEYIFPFAKILNIPLVQVASSFMVPWQNEAIGNPNYLSTDNSLFVSEDSDSFSSRLIKYYKSVKLLLRYKYSYIPRLEQGTKSYFPSNVSNIEKISKNTSLIIVNTHSTMDFPRPTLSNVIEIGGLHCKPAKTLPNDLKNFIDGANETGLIYVSFGSTIQSQFPPSLQKSFINVFRKIRQRVIWKVTSDVVGLPDNVKAMKWCPQQDILGHNNTKLFISQGGTLSLQESLYHGVPVLVMPLSFDQPTNARIAQKIGYGRYLRFTNFTEDNFLREITEILSNKKYENKAIETSIQLKEGQKLNTNKLKWWINHIIRYKGNPTYRPKNDDFYHWTRWIETDILLFVMAFIVILLIVLRSAFEFIIKLYIKNNIYVKDKSI